MLKANKNKGRTPGKNRHTVNIFIEATKKISCALKLSNQNNLIQTSIRVKEWQLFKELSKREDITITNTDKGGAIIIIDDTKYYIKEAKCQLNDKGNYHILPQNPTLCNNKLVKQAIDCFRKRKTHH